MELVGWGEAVSLILLIWLSFLSYLFWKQKKFFSDFFPKTDQDQFKKLLFSVEEVEKREQALRRGLKDLGLDGLNHLQRIEVLRYNPYNDTGGQQSFSVCLLDGKLNGLILSSLHSRSGTRTYIKPIAQGESELELSKEEKQVLDKVTR